MWELDYKESWATKNWCFWTVVLEKTLESPLNFKEIQPVHLKGDKFWVFIVRTDAEAETPVLWPPHGKSWLIGKDIDAGRDWGQEEKRTAENAMVVWHHWHNRQEFLSSPGIGDGQGGLACCGSWGCRVRHNWVTELNWTVLSGTVLPPCCLAWGNSVLESIDFYNRTTGILQENLCRDVSLRTASVNAPSLYQATDHPHLFRRPSNTHR